MNTWYHATVKNATGFDLLAPLFPAHAPVMVAVRGAAILVFNPDTGGATIFPREPHYLAILDAWTPRVGDLLATVRDARGKQIPASHDYSADFIVALIAHWVVLPTAEAVPGLVSALDAVPDVLATLIAESRARIQAESAAAQDAWVNETLAREAAAERANDIALSGADHDQLVSLRA